jgi:hypothetical protein
MFSVFSLISSKLIFLLDSPNRGWGQQKHGHEVDWVSLCTDTKLVPSWVIGNRSDKAASNFIQDLKSRLKTGFS